ncbi:MAG: hypothetical protein HFE86_08325 [Clostridiales bacterium]|nr:hypothetical protein [Clostridiales bacterium]
MAYQIGRTTPIIEDLELIDQDGRVCETLHVEIDADRMAQEFNRRYNDIIRAELELKRLRASDLQRAGKTDIAAPETQGSPIDAALRAYGNASAALCGLVFGEEGAQRLLTFYENRYTELLTEVLPFITQVVAPRIRQATADKQRRLAHQYKLGRAAETGLFKRRPGR